MTLVCSSPVAAMATTGSGASSDRALGREAEPKAWAGPSCVEPCGAWGLFRASSGSCGGRGTPVFCRGCHMALLAVPVIRTPVTLDWGPPCSNLASP